jgi:hypothetical protein
MFAGLLKIGARPLAGTEAGSPPHAPHSHGAALTIHCAGSDATQLDREASVQLSMGFVWAGALLVVLGVLYAAARALWSGGRLSEAKGPRAGRAGQSLEPRGPGSGLQLKSNWPGLALIALGFVLLLAGAFV